MRWSESRNSRQPSVQQVDRLRNARIRLHLPHRPGRQEVRSLEDQLRSRDEDRAPPDDRQPTA